MSSIKAFRPIRRSPLEAAHELLGARWHSDVARWPLTYGDLAAEVTAVRRACGLNDWGPLDKLSVKGAVTESLLAIGVVHRPGLIVIRDAGADYTEVWSLAPDEALIMLPIRSDDHSGSSRTAALAAVLDESNGSIVDVSSGLAALRLVGPNARAVLERVCPVDLRPSTLSDRRMIFGPVANLAASLARSDLPRGTPCFTILVARDQAAYLWAVLLREGAPLGLTPVGSLALDWEV